jgi:hypothetical protein
VRWDERKLPNVADYEAVVVNSVPLAQIIKDLPADDSDERCGRVQENQRMGLSGTLTVLGTLSSWGMRSGATGAKV